MKKIEKLSDEQLDNLPGEPKDLKTSINPNARLSMYRQTKSGSPK
jgi:hypothetical protein